MVVSQTPARSGALIQPSPVSAVIRGIFLANLVAQIAIVVTGGLVRLTGSGLGCPAWPECVEGSLVPVAGQAESFHKLIEFGNRTLTSVLSVLAIAALVGAWRMRRTWLAEGSTPRRPVLLLAAVPLAGTMAQALLGGLTVLTGLNPMVVGTHFLLSILVIGGCVVLVKRAGEPGDEPRVLLVPTAVLGLSRALLVVCGIVLVLGTLVTGSGPHSGDADVDHRLPFDLRTIAWMHADMVMLLVGLVIAMWLVLHVTEGPPQARSWAHTLMALVVIQGVVGYTQWFTGVPWMLVAVHMLLACLIWVSAVNTHLGLRSRGVPAPA